MTRSTKTIAQLREQMLRSHQGFRKRWEATQPKRELAVALARMRAAAGLTQAQVAERAGWDKAFVSRLESATGPVPDVATLSRYAAACDMVAGIVFAALSPKQMHVVEAVTLQPSVTDHPFEGLRDSDLAIGTSPLPGIAVR